MFAVLFLTNETFIDILTRIHQMRNVFGLYRLLRQLGWEIKTLIYIPNVSTAGMKLTNHVPTGLPLEAAKERNLAWCLRIKTNYNEEINHECYRPNQRYVTKGK